VMDNGAAANLDHGQIQPSSARSKDAHGIILT
jgi:hypothetical protein